MPESQELTEEHEHGRKPVDYSAQHLINLGDSARKAGEYGLAGDSYNKAIALLEKELARTMLHGNAEAEELKHQLLLCKIKVMSNKLEFDRQATDEATDEAKTAEITPHIAYDEGREKRSLINETEQSIIGYGIQNQALVWNEMEIAYDRLERVSHGSGRTYEAAEFNFAMMNARRRRMRSQRHWANYIALTVAHYLTGYGHRLWRAVAWIAAIILSFAFLYWVSYLDLGLNERAVPPLSIPIPLAVLCLPDPLRQSTTMLFWCLSQLVTSMTRYMHSLLISIAMLFLPGQFDLQPINPILKGMVGFNQLLAYAVNVGIIALLVNKLASRRKW